MTLDEIKDSFQFFDNWEDKYRFIIDLGKNLAHLPEDQKTDCNLVRGCQSQVWLVEEFDADNGTIRLAIDSDAHIVRGLIAIVLACYNDQTPTFIANHDMDALFTELELLEHLSPTRGNGLRAMVARVKGLANQHL